MNDLAKRVEELTHILNEANYNYYVNDNPTITDQEYDKYLRELINIETEHPELMKPNSPTNRVGGEVIDKFNKIVHARPMLSLANVFNEDEIRDFDANIKKEGFNPEYVCEYLQPDWSGRNSGGYSFSHLHLPALYQFCTGHFRHDRHSLLCHGSAFVPVPDSPAAL